MYVHIRLNFLVWKFRTEPSESDLGTSAGAFRTLGPEFYSYCSRTGIVELWTDLGCCEDREYRRAAVVVHSIFIISSMCILTRKCRAEKEKKILVRESERDSQRHIWWGI